MADAKDPTVWLRNNTGYSKRYITRQDLTDKVVALDCAALVTDENGTVLSSSVTPTTASVYSALWNFCPIFRSDIQSGSLVKSDTQPKDAVSDGQKISDLNDEVTRLRTELETAMSSSPAADLQKQLDELRAENDTLKAQISGEK